MILLTEKQCSKCKETKTIENFGTQLKRGKQVYHSRCKICKREDDRIRAKRLQQLSDEDRPVYTEKRCSQCHEVKPIAEFYRAKNKSNGYRPACIACNTAIYQNRAQAVREQHKKLVDEYLASGIKKCIECKELKPFEAFRIKKNRPDGIETKCKKCRSKINHEKYKQNPRDPQIARDRYLRTVFGLKVEVYQDLFEKQNGVCAACGNPEINIDPRTGKARRLAIDHSHETGAVRGLLCQACNVSLGLLKDNPERIKALLNYIEEWE